MKALYQDLYALVDTVNQNAYQESVGDITNQKA